MSAAYNDAWLWLGLSCFTAFTIYTVYSGQSELLKLAEVHPAAQSKQNEQPQWEVNQDTEDRVSADALFELAKSSTNAEIRKSATKILFERMLHDEEAVASLRRDVRGAPGSSAYHNIKRLEALADSFHDSHPSQLLEAALYPRARSRTTHFRTADELNEALRALTNQLSGRTDGQPRPSRRDRSTTPLPGIRRAVSIGEFEQEVRRRRREAIVLNEGDRPVTQDDIIQRRREGVSVGVMGSSGWSGDGREGIDAEIVDAIEQELAILARGEDVQRRGPWWER